MGVPVDDRPSVVFRMVKCSCKEPVDVYYTIEDSFLTVVRHSLYIREPKKLLPVDKRYQFRQFILDSFKNALVMVPGYLDEFAVTACLLLDRFPEILSTLPTFDDLLLGSHQVYRLRETTEGVEVEEIPELDDHVRLVVTNSTDHASKGLGIVDGEVKIGDR